MDLTSEERSKQDCNGSITLDIIDNIAIIRFEKGENRLNWAFIEKFNALLDQVERNAEVKALITTGDNRFYCNGLDLKWLTFLRHNAPDKLQEFTNQKIPGVLCRLLTFPVPTIAAINGHCYAGGVLLALCHDCRLMNTDKGWFCLNEVFINIPFAETSRTVLRHKIPSGMAFHEATVFGKQYTAKEAEDAGIINQTCPQKDLLQNSMALVNKLTHLRVYDRASLQNMKKAIYSDVLAARDRAAVSKTVNITSQL